MALEEIANIILEQKRRAHRLETGLKGKCRNGHATAASPPVLPVPSWRLSVTPSPSRRPPAPVTLGPPAPQPSWSPANRRPVPRPAGSSTPQSNQASWRPWCSLATGQTGGCPAMPRDLGHRLTYAERCDLAFRYQTSKGYQDVERRVLRRHVVVLLCLLLGVEGQADADTAGVNWRRSQSGGVEPQGHWAVELSKSRPSAERDPPPRSLAVPCPSRPDTPIFEHPLPPESETGQRSLSARRARRDGARTRQSIASGGTYLWRIAVENWPQ
ncbi:hypothetical protein QBC39DRAFT_34627 [Podospora conica]|nr:hypothetical protein QBC39DRAFT_34627 [Schizothecium conicum]